MYEENLWDDKKHRWVIDEKPIIPQTSMKYPKVLESLTTIVITNKHITILQHLATSNTKNQKVECA